jgi:hypothetical protein
MSKPRISVKFTPSMLNTLTLALDILKSDYDGSDRRDDIHKECEAIDRAVEIGTAKRDRLLNKRAARKHEDKL